MTEIPIAQARLERNVTHGGFDVHVLARRMPHGVDVLSPLVPPAITHVLDGSYHSPTPAFILQYQSAQALLDALWEAGMRPSSGVGKQDESKTSLAISLMKDHLADLRRIAFGQDQVVSADTPMTKIDLDAMRM